VASRNELENVSYQKHLGYIPNEEHKNEIAEIEPPSSDPRVFQHNRVVSCHLRTVFKVRCG
jgi:hypothetical protein